MSKIYEALIKTESTTGSTLQKIRAEQEVQADLCSALPPEFMEVAPAEDVAGPSPQVELATPPRVFADYRTVPVRIEAEFPLFPFDGSNDQAAEQYRIVRTNLLRHFKKPKVIAISSASAGDGKTVTAINIGGALALKSETEVLLVDADLRRGSVSSFLGIDAKPGLSDVLSGNATAEEAIVRLEQLPTMFVLPAGERIYNPTELLDSVAWRGLIARMRDRFRFIVIDITPIAATADYAQAEQVADGVIMIVRPDHTNRRICNDAFQGIAPDKFLGSIVNTVPDWFLSRNTDYYYSGRSQ